MAVKTKEKESIGMQIKSHFKTLGWLAEQIGMSQGYLSKKINNVKYYKWKQEELDKINKVLGTNFKL